MYASNAGKSGGEFFTPADVSELLTRLGTVDKTEVNKVYDPACGSGSLLLKSLKILGKEGVRNGFYGQEINITTYNLCRINMFLHDIDFDKFNIAHEDTLISPQHWDEEPFEVIVSNPPYIRRCESRSMSANVLEYEPHIALFVPNESPLLFYEKIAKDSVRLLSPGGKLYFEINEAQGEACARMLEAAGYKHIRIIKDLYEKNRFVSAIKPIRHG